MLDSTKEAALFSVRKMRSLASLDLEYDEGTPSSETLGLVAEFRWLKRLGVCASEPIGPETLSGAFQDDTP